jgi:Family of unknown function (DUF6122)
VSAPALLHIVLHFVVPGVLARVAFRDRWATAWLVMVATIVVDLDHLLAEPIYQPDRCSIGFHPLHTSPAIAVYAVLALARFTRLIGVGLLLHMVLDALDCLRM